jgi:hypothetical protein
MLRAVFAGIRAPRYTEIESVPEHNSGRLDKQQINVFFCDQLAANYKPAPNRPTSQLPTTTSLAIRTTTTTTTTTWGLEAILARIPPMAVRKP